MTPPDGPGQRAVLRSHYERAGSGRVAFLDETYSLERGRPRFYVMSAVVVDHADLAPLRDEIDLRVPSGWWHTSDELRLPGGRLRSRDLLGTLRHPEEACIIVDATRVDDADTEGLQARGRALGALLAHLSATAEGHLPVSLVIAEEQREARKNNWDRSIRKALIAQGAISPSMQMIHASPGAEHLLWLPDLVCSAYRQLKVFDDGDLFTEIADIAQVTELP